MTAAAPPESAQGFSLGAPPSLRAWVDRVATVLLGLATGTLIVLVLGALAGYQAMVDRSDSMRPEIRAGDLIVVRQAAARTAAVGDVVTFWDPAEKRSVTHRVVERRPQAGAISFTTRGDANRTSERWTASPEARVGLLTTSLPRIGYVVGWLTVPGVRLLLVTCCGLALCVSALRWIWREDARPGR